MTNQGVMSAPADTRQVQNVLIVTYEYPPLGGGGGVIIRDLAEELAQRIHVTILTSGRPGLPPDECRGNLRIVRVPVLLRTANAVASLPSLLSFFPSSLWTGLRLMREEHFDLVHSSFAVPSGPSGLLLARRAGVPHVLTIHGGDIYDPTKTLSPHRTPLLKQTVRTILHRSTRVVANSVDTERRTREIYGLQDLDRIPLAVRPLSVPPANRTDVGIADGQVALITIGRLVERKGLAQLIDALAEAADPSMKLIVLGEGPKREEWEAHARARGVADRIRWEGFVSDERKWGLLQAADLYVSTALHEGFGIGFVEGMVSGLPVVSYDCGGHTDFLTSEFSRLVPVNDVAGFARELRSLCADGDLRARMGQAARTAAAEFGIEHYTQRYVNLYNACLREARQPETV